MLNLTCYSWFWENNSGVHIPPIEQPRMVTESSWCRSSLIDELCEESGKGDVTISEFTSQDIIKKNITSQDTGVIYYYCDFSDPRSLERRNLSGALIRQLLEDIHISDELEQQITTSCGQHPEAIMDEGLVSVLLRAIRHFSKVYLFIDGLDECKCEEQTAILSMLHELSRSQQPTVKILVSSRDEHTISHSLKKFHQLRIAAESNSADIDFFVKKTVKNKIQSGELRVRDFSLQSEIITSLTSQAHGMFVSLSYCVSIGIMELTYTARFLWVHFQIADLSEADSDHDIRQALQSLPQGMAETYARAVNKTARNSMKVNRAQKIFKWIACAKRPLFLAELAEAVAFHPSDKCWDSAKIPDTSRLIQGCGNLVVLDDDGTTRFAHHTVQQFLTGLPLEKSTPDFHFKSRDADIEAGEVCMTYLSFSDFETQVTIPESHIIQQTRQLPSPTAIISSLVPDYGIWNVRSNVSKFWRYLLPRKVRQRSLSLEIDISPFVELKRRPEPDMSKRYQFLTYAVENWLYHTSEITESDTSWSKFKYLATDKPSSFDIRPWGNPSVSSRLPYMGLFRWAIYAGHVGLLELLVQLPNSNLKGYCHQASNESFSLMIYAALHGHSDMIKFLLDKNCIDLTDGTALLELARSGNAFAVRLIPDLKLCDGVRDSALRIATKEWRSEVLWALLENGPALDLQNGWGKVVLENAVKRRSTDILAMLIAKAADFEATLTEVESTWDGSLNMLCEFAKLGMNVIFQQMLKTGKADANERDPEYGKTPLHWAAERGQKVIVELLLETGKVDVNSKDTTRRSTPLSWAVEGGHWELVQQLLETGKSDVNSTDQLGRTPLISAARHRDEAMVKLLLETGKAEIDLKDASGQTPLSCAAEHGHKAIIELLLATGKVEPDSEDVNGRTLLSLAAQHDHEEAMKQLLENDKVQIDKKDSNGRTPLSWAAESYSGSGLRLLLETGMVEVDSRDFAGRTPLSWAVEYGHATPIDILLRTGKVDVNSRDSKGRTPLHWVFKNLYGQKHPVRQLLDTGKVHVNSMDLKGQTPLSLALQLGHTDMVELLSRGQVMMTIRSPYVHFPLHVVAG